MLPMGWGGDPTVLLVLRGGLIPLRHSPVPAGVGGTGEPPGVWPPRGVSLWAWPFGAWPPGGVALLLDVCQLKDLLRLWWCLCWGWGVWGGPLGGWGCCPTQGGSRLHPLCDAPPLYRNPPTYRTPSLGSAHFPANHASNPGGAALLLVSAQAPAANQEPRLGAGRGQRRGPFAGREVTLQGGDITDR